MNALHRLGGALVALMLLFYPALALAQEVLTVQLAPAGGSGVSGTATLSAAGDGTVVALKVVGLAAGADARATMHAGTCDLPGASFVALPDLKADASGTAAAEGAVLFHGTEPVALATMADGEHVLLVRVEEVVACGIIPRLATASAPPALPETGGAAIPLGAAVLGVAGLSALSAGLFLRRPMGWAACDEEAS